MSRTNLQPYYSELREDIAQGVAPGVAVLNLGSRVMEALPHGDESKGIDLLRHVCEGLVIEQCLQSAEAQKGNLGSFGLGIVGSQIEDFMNAYPKDLIGVNSFGEDELSYARLASALNQTLSVYVHDFFDRPKSDGWHHFVQVYRRFFGSRFTESRVLKFTITGGIQTAGRTMSGALRALPLLAPGYSEKQYLQGAEASTASITGLAMMPIEVLFRFEAKVPGQDIISESCFSVDESGPAPILRANIELIRKAYEKGVTSNRIHTGCPAHTSLPEKDSPIERIWSWYVETAGKAGFYRRQ